MDRENKTQTGFNKLWGRDYTLLCANSLFMNTAFDFIKAVFPLYIMQFMHTNKTTVGLVLSFFSFGGIFMRPFAGMMLDNYGRRIIFYLAMIIFALVFNLYSVAGTVVIFGALHFLHGMAWGSYGISGSTVLIDIIPGGKRGTGLGYHGIASSVGAMIGPAMAIAIVGAAGYNTMFLCACLLCLIGFFIGALVKYPPYKPKEKKPNFKALFEKNALPVSFNFFLSAITIGGLTSFIAIYAKERGAGNIGLFFSLAAIMGILSRWIGGIIFNRRGPREILSFGLIMLVVCFPALVLIKSAWGFYIGGIFYGTGSGILYLTFQVMVNNLVGPERRGAANATLFTILNIGYAIGKFSTGFFADLISLGNTFLLYSVVNLVSVLVFISFVHRHYVKKFNIRVNQHAVEK